MNRSHIATGTGLNYNRLGPYLDDLEKHYELIGRSTPIFSKKETSKNYNYRLYDPFTKFWFRYLFKNGRYLEIEADDTLLSIIEKYGIVDPNASYYVQVENLTNMDNHDLKPMA
jgi:hypothetical protein